MPRIRKHAETPSISYPKKAAKIRARGAERKSVAEREDVASREARLPGGIRPSAPVHWGYAFSLADGFPESERAELVAFLERFTSVDDSGHGFVVVGPNTASEVRRAAWNADGNLVEVEQLRAQMPSRDHAERHARLTRVLSQRSGRAWSEAVMLLSTWDAQTLPAAIADAEHLLADWPDELRVGVEAWKDRSELRALVRVHRDPLGPAADVARITVLQTGDTAGLEDHAGRFAHVATLDVSGTGIPDLLLRCTAFTALERLILQPPIRSAGTAPGKLKQLLRAPHLQKLTGLSLYGHTLDDDDLEALATCEQPLEHLRLQRAALSPRSAAQIARLAARRPLRTLDLKHNGLGPDGARALFAIPGSWGCLRVLNLSANEIGSSGVRAIADAGLGELRWLDVSSTYPAKRLSVAAARALAAAPFDKLETLIVGGHPLDGKGVAALLHSPRLRALRGLNAMSTEASLADIVAHSEGEPVALTALHLGANFVFNPTRPKLDLSRAAFLRGVRTLNLETLAGSEHAALLTCPHLEQLETLVLGPEFDGREEAFAALTSSIPPPRLRYLRLNGWTFTAAEAAKLAASPLARQLWGLDLHNIYTTPETWQEMHRVGLPLVGPAMYDGDAPNGDDRLTQLSDGGRAPYQGEPATFREEI